MMNREQPLVACVNSSEDVAQLLRDGLVVEGIRAVAHVPPLCYGSEPTIDFLTELAPDVVLYTVSLPYRASFGVFQQIQTAVPSAAAVLTTTNARALDEVLGPSEAI